MKTVMSFSALVLVLVLNIAFAANDSHRHAQPHMSHQTHNVMNPWLSSVFPTSGFHNGNATHKVHKSHIPFHRASNSYLFHFKTGPGKPEYVTLYAPTTEGRHFVVGTVNVNVVKQTHEVECTVNEQFKHTATTKNGYSEFRLDLTPVHGCLSIGDDIALEIDIGEHWNHHHPSNSGSYKLRGIIEYTNTAVGIVCHTQDCIRDDTLKLGESLRIRTLPSVRGLQLKHDTQSHGSRLAMTDYTLKSMRVNGTDILKWHGIEGLHIDTDNTGETQVLGITKGCYYSHKHRDTCRGMTARVTNNQDKTPTTNLVFEFGNHKNEFPNVVRIDSALLSSVNASKVELPLFLDASHSDSKHPQFRIRVVATVSSMQDSVHVGSGAIRNWKQGITKAVHSAKNAIKDKLSKVKCHLNTTVAVHSHGTAVIHTHPLQTCLEQTGVGSILDLRIQDSNIRVIGVFSAFQLGVNKYIENKQLRIIARPNNDVLRNAVHTKMVHHSNQNEFVFIADSQMRDTAAKHGKHTGDAQSQSIAADLHAIHQSHHHSHHSKTRVNVHSRRGHKHRGEQRRVEVIYALTFFALLITAAIFVWHLFKKIKAGQRYSRIQASSEPLMGVETTIDY